MEKKIRLGIFDDHAFFVKGLTDFLDKHKDLISVLFIAHTREDLLKQLELQLPDVMLMDVLAPDVTGLELYVETLKKHKTLRILSYTSLRSVILVENLLELGVKGYVNKNQPPEDLLQGIRDVGAGLITVPHIYKDLIPEGQRTVKNIFTEREFEIMQLLAKGDKAEKIAGELNVSLRTIENLKATLFKKLGVKSAAELIIVATRLGYLS
jgi:DNA-binding NarL/FixJ family response regulator